MLAQVALLDLRRRAERAARGHYPSGVRIDPVQREVLRRRRPVPRPAARRVLLPCRHEERQQQTLSAAGVEQAAPVWKEAAAQQGKEYRVEAQLFVREMPRISSRRRVRPARRVKQLRDEQVQNRYALRKERSRPRG